MGPRLAGLLVAVASTGCGLGLEGGSKAALPMPFAGLPLATQRLTLHPFGSAMSLPSTRSFGR